MHISISSDVRNDNFATIDGRSLQRRRYIMLYRTRVPVQRNVSGWPSFNISSAHRTGIRRTCAETILVDKDRESCALARREALLKMNALYALWGFSAEDTVFVHPEREM